MKRLIKNNLFKDYCQKKLCISDVVLCNRFHYREGYYAIKVWNKLDECFATVDFHRGDYSYRVLNMPQGMFVEFCEFEDEWLELHKFNKDVEEILA